MVPCVVKAPSGAALNPAWTPGGVSRSFATCMDLYPTFLDVIHHDLPITDGKLAHRGLQTYPPTGKSWYKHWQSADSDSTYAFWSDTDAVGWELHSLAALKKGDYKIVYIKRENGGKAHGQDDPNGWELFNLRNDPGETRDLAEHEPEKFKELLSAWDEYVRETNVVWGPEAMQAGLSVSEAPELHEVDLDLQRTWLQTPHGSAPSLKPIRA